MSVTVAVAVSPDEPFAFREVELEDLRDDEVRVRIVGSGICHTDVAVKEQSVELPLPMVLGHEGSGVVEAVGSGVRNVAPGDHVVLSGDSCGGSAVRSVAFFVTSCVNPSEKWASTRKSSNWAPTGN